jgi:hypothetical protein
MVLIRNLGLEKRLLQASGRLDPQQVRLVLCPSLDFSLFDPRSAGLPEVRASAACGECGLTSNMVVTRLPVRHER